MPVPLEVLVEWPHGQQLQHQRARHKGNAEQANGHAAPQLRPMHRHFLELLTEVVVCQSPYSDLDLEIFVRDPLASVQGTRTAILAFHFWKNKAIIIKPQKPKVFRVKSSLGGKVFYPLKTQF